MKTREGFKFWDQPNALLRYMLLLRPSDTGAQKLEDNSTDNWIDVHEAQQVVDQAPEEINQLHPALHGQNDLVEAETMLRLLIALPDRTETWQITGKISIAQLSKLFRVPRDYRNLPIELIIVNAA